MGIDSIGKKGPPAPPPPAETGGPSRSAETGRPFEVPKPAPAPPANAVVPAPTALERLRAGELDVNGYVEVKVNEATAHLAALPPAEIEGIRAALRERLNSDPTLVDLLRTATGAAPTPPRDE
ncbi:MAG TPA: hypothetical protein VIF15_18260 [Polyangiaceae bacterium]|jgi:hypothetical protein